jgi:exodeoxyribonuclease X
MRICAVDLETTGVEPTDRVVEFASTDLYVKHDLVLKPHGFLINPGIPIPPNMSAIHHITDEDVADKPDWETAATIILNAVGGDVDGVAVGAFAAHNAKFERQWITDELTGGKPWICTYRCALRVWPDAPGHSNQQLRYWLKPEGLDRNVANLAHRAGPRVPFGKHRGQKWSDVPLDYLGWITRQDDMSEDVKFTARHYLEGDRS